MAQSLLHAKSPLAILGGGGQKGERIKCLIFDSEMCTLQKVGGEDSKGRIVL